MTEQTLRIVQLYPDLLGVTGDRGNVDVLAFRARARGIDVTTEAIGIGEGDLAGADVIVIGNGPLSAMRSVLADLQSRREQLAAHVASGGVVLAVGGGAELLSTGVDTADGEPLSGLGLLPFRARRTRQRKVGYLIADTDLGRLIGFEDHASDWSLTDQATPWGTVTSGTGSTAGAGEGVRVRNAIATTAQGPLLPLNPELADGLLAAALARTSGVLGTSEALAELDRYAVGARAKIDSLQTKTFNAIQL